MLLVTCLVLAVSLGANGQGCPANQEWNDCGSPCTSACWNRKPVCAEYCVSKCECPKDTYWHERNEWCYNAEECDSMGLFNGSAPWWATTTRMPTPMTTYQHCDWCRYDACDENYDCTYGYATSTPGPWTTTPYPGDCSDRCLYGDCDYNGKCTHGCANNRYGWDCSQWCSSNCLDAQCHKEMGYCIHGCVNGTEGAFCEDYCPQGCHMDWGCDLSYDYYKCPSNKTCYDCGCQGSECMYDGPFPSSATIPAATPLYVTMIAACITLLRG